MKGRTIRGIRDPIPPGTVIGRQAGGRGQAKPQILTNRELAQQLVRTGMVAPAGVKSPGGLAPIGANDVLANLQPIPAVPVGTPIASLLTAAGGILGTVSVVTQTTDVYLR